MAQGDILPTESDIPVQTADVTPPDPREIAILAYPGVQMAAVLGLSDLFAIAGRLAGRAGGGLRVSHWQAGRGAGGLRCIHRCDGVAGRGPSRLQDRVPGTVIIPPTLVDLPDAESRGAIAGWLMERHAQGAGLVSVCSGVFLVAETGLLDGCMVSTHWSCAQNLTETFPRIAVDTSQRMIEHPGILTAGGFLAWLDVGLILIQRLLGDAVRDETAEFVMSGEGLPRNPGARRFLPPRDHGDLPVRRAQDLVHLRDGRDITLALMASAARLERRTFIRRFAGATGMTPARYCLAVRIDRGCELLEASSFSVAEIAGMLGYRNPDSFVRAFRRAHGRSPAAFRRGAGDGAPPGAA